MKKTPAGSFGARACRTLRVRLMEGGREALPPSFAASNWICQRILATVPWADFNEIRKIYREADRLTTATGIKHNVDHIIPLHHPRVSGLHVHFNLRARPPARGAEYRVRCSLRGGRGHYHVGWFAMTYYDDHEDKHIGTSRRRFFGNRSPKKQAEVRQADRRAMHVPPEAYLDRKALKAAPGSPLARARIAAHDAFDPLWQSGTMSRRSAYDWLAIQLHLPVSACHMVLFDVAMCGKVVAICRKSVECNRVAFDVAAADFEDLTK